MTRNSISIGDCTWSSWSFWSECTKTCDVGKRTANRTITEVELDGGKICEGPKSRIEECNTDPCPGFEDVDKYSGKV